MIVRVGLNIQSGQNLVISGAYTRGVDITLAPFVRLIAASAYRAGARYVDVIWDDPAMLLVRFQKAPRDSFNYYPNWAAKAIAGYLERADAYLLISADIPDLLVGQDAGLIGQMVHLAAEYGKPVGELRSRNASNCCLAPGAVPAWAAQVFPDQSPDDPLDLLWEAIFSFCRVDRADPVAAWKAHVKTLTTRANYLNTKAYDRLHYVGPGTDLTIGLPAGAFWTVAGFKSENGIDFMANIPTEEVFTLPHRQRIDGIVHSTRPLSRSGFIIDDFVLSFENGRVVQAVAGRGQDILEQLLATDENAVSLGEVSFVPYSSPISRRHTLFFNTLIDENAASHLALGNARRFSMTGGEHMTQEQFKAAGGNQSSVHIDFMVGSQHLDVDGITKEGVTEAIMHQGEWAFTV